MREFILGTDFCSDCDDCMAVRIICRAHKKGEIKLSGICLNVCEELSVQALGGFVANEGVDIPLGADKGATDLNGNSVYHKRLAAIPSNYKSADDAEDGVKMYRRILANAENKVEIIEIGFLQVLSALIDSKPDEISPLDGKELVRQKVDHIWIMAGEWPSGNEYNFAGFARTRKDSANVCENCPAPITYLGWECGHDVFSGGHLSENDLLHGVLEDYKRPNGHCSWDPMTVVLALKGSPEAYGFTSIKGTASVNPKTGDNSFTVDKNAKDEYVVRLCKQSYYSDIINELLG